MAPEQIQMSNAVCDDYFKRRASKAAEGCLASEAAKLVKTAIENLFTISQTTCAQK